MESNPFSGSFQLIDGARLLAGDSPSSVWGEPKVHRHRARGRAASVETLALRPTVHGRSRTAISQTQDLESLTLCHFNRLRAVASLCSGTSALLALVSRAPVREGLHDFAVAPSKS